MNEIKDKDGTDRTAAKDGQRLAQHTRYFNNKNQLKMQLTQAKTKKTK